MLKSSIVSLILVCGITAQTTPYEYEAPTGCNTSLSYESCVQPATSASACDDDDVPCACSVQDLDRKCVLKYCASLTYTSSSWMRECTGLGYSYINDKGYYITAPETVKATATASSSSAAKTEASSAAKESSSSSSSKASSSRASSQASSQASSSQASSAQAGSVNLASSPPTSTASSTASSSPNDAARAMGFPSGGLVAILVTAAGAMAGMLLL